jgi:hypothetical protein
VTGQHHDSNASGGTVKDESAKVVAPASTARSSVEASKPARTCTPACKLKMSFCLVGVVILCAAAGGYLFSGNGQTKVVGPSVSLGTSTQVVKVSDSEKKDGENGQASAAAKDEHPLDPALRIAREGLDRIRREVHDYTAVMIKRELVGNKLFGPDKMFVKIRNRKAEEGKIVTPLSVYMIFQEPSPDAGREVIWVENANDGKLIAHEAGIANLFRVKLPPDGPLAMMGNRYPITNIGIENLVAKLIEKGERGRQHDECEVEIRRDAQVDGRSCMLIEVRHPHPRPHFDFMLAQIFIDDELNVPVRYAAYSWPLTDGGEPALLEEYTYTNVKLNVGLTDADFDPDNPAYNYPKSWFK